MSPVPWPTSPRQLLEARYQAFVDGNIDFLMESIHPEVRDQHSRESVSSWANNSKWLGLNIEEEEIEGDKGSISFAVKYEQEGRVMDHRETAEFRLEGERWYYYDSTYPKGSTVRRENPKVGRNDPCPCGSGKKIKKCCGKAL